MLERQPSWLTLPACDPAPLEEMERLLKGHGLHTVCESAGCPNQLDCFARRTCTFMILGDRCTRSCRFCGVSHGHPQAVDPGEPRRVAQMAQVLGLQHAVVTSVTRDDLRDGGAGQFARTISELGRVPNLIVELLVPDFRGDPDSLQTVIDSAPGVIAHNVETVPRLYPRVRPGAVYERSLDLITSVSNSTSISKSGLMLGLGETLEEVIDVLGDLRSAGCDVVTVGQYLRPDDDCLPVESYVHPETFAMLQGEAEGLGFGACLAGPFVRSSFHAKECYESALQSRIWEGESAQGNAAHEVAASHAESGV
jgi:lipoyl synthase